MNHFMPTLSIPIAFPTTKTPKPATIKTGDYIVAPMHPVTNPALTT